MGVQLVAVSAGSPKECEKAKKASGGEYTFISDESGKLIEEFGLLHEGGHPFDGSDIARIGKILIDQKGKVLWLKFTDNSRVRITSNDLIKELKNTTQNQ